MVLAFPLSAQEGPDPWERLRQFDQDKDGNVARGEFRNAAALFDRLDANADGVVSEEEARSMRGRLGLRGRGNFGQRSGEPGQMFIWGIDANKDEKLSLQEWTDFFKKADENGDNVVEPEEWHAAIRQQPVKDPAPSVGSNAPKVKAKALKSGREVDLSAPRRPTVLIFGSHT